MSPYRVWHEPRARAKVSRPWGLLVFAGFVAVASLLFVVREPILWAFYVAAVAGWYWRPASVRLVEGQLEITIPTVLGHRRHRIDPTEVIDFDVERSFGRYGTLLHLLLRDGDRYRVEVSGWSLTPRREDVLRAYCSNLLTHTGQGGADHARS